MTKMATMPIYGKNMKDSSPLEPKCWWPWHFDTSTTKFVKWWPLVDLDLFYSNVKFHPICFCMGKVKTMDFSETVIVYDIKLGRCSQLNEYKKLYEYQRSRSLIDRVSVSILLNFFFSITTMLTEAKFHMDPPWNGGTKACSNGAGHIWYAHIW